ncbi:hypothetical protein AQUSIP_03650 [Aquicella siphonis]|uniref:Uncharacterized protein n=1 Tax=Aquicella siphonis TaxID=254247 RepID=A0A5E4PDR2_9COXI|nr:hypothetical protein [Aquicella siphonis]VVC75089.1 hypothetical protein AQUSIP_03650 [Aquicella siphonis]
MFRSAPEVTEIELEEFNKAKTQESIENNRRWSALVSFFESLDLAAIYALFLKSFLHKFLEETGKYFLFPIAAAASLITAALAWREAYLSGGKTRTLVHAGVETVAAAAITTAVVGSLVATTLFAVATPIIFTTVMAAKTVYHAGAAMYYLGKSVGKSEPEKKAKYRSMAAGNAIAAIAGVVATAAVAGVFLLGKTVVAGVGLAVGLFGAGYAVYRGVSSYLQSRAARRQQAAARDVEESADHQHEHDYRPTSSPGNSLTIAKGLGVTEEDLRNRSVSQPAHREPTAPVSLPGQRDETTALLTDYDHQEALTPTQGRLRLNSSQ